jgi:heptaprenyl diphosphate synthase
MSSKNRHIAYRTAFSGLLLAMAIALSALEGMLPPLPVGIKPGLSNIVTMYAVFFLGARQALLIAFLKSSFVFLTRGVTGAFLSLLGGFLSVGVMLLLRRVHGLSNVFISIGGAVFHNLGQLFGAVLLLKSTYTLYYAPILILSGIGMGLLTGVLLRFVMPCLDRIDRTLQ